MEPYFHPKESRVRSMLLALCIFGGLIPGTSRAQSSGEGSKPPGDCTKAEYRQFNQAVGDACKKDGMRCEGFMDCQSLISRWEMFERCIQTRRTLMERCFRGGDLAHRSMLETYLNGQARCLRLIHVVCSVDEANACGG
jgi:hypothetical protein